VGKAETPVAGGGKVGVLNHGARDAWRKGSRGGRRCGTRGGATARELADRGRPRRAGPARPRRGRRANADVGAALERQGQNQFSLPVLTEIFSPKI
jgi:hypothetical protein